MTQVASIGIWLLFVGVVAIVLEGTLAGLWSLRLAKRARALSAQLMSERSQLRSDVERLQAALSETQVLWQPYRRLLRWLRHPLTIALMQSFARRRAAAR